MANPAELLYSKEHEWAKFEGDVATVGITDYAQSSLGDIVFVEFPKVGVKVEQFGTAGVVESVKSVSDIFSPIGGEVLAVNEAIEGDPGIVNREPYAGGWLYKIKVVDADAQKGRLLSVQAYERLLGQ